jgi:hypothetical protein
MTDRMPDEEAQVEPSDDWARGAAADASAGSGAQSPGGETLTAATMFAPGAVSEATTDDGRGPAEG